MSGINFNPQPIKNWKVAPKTKEDSNKQAPQTGDINDFMKTKEGQAFLAAFKTNQANKPKPDASGFNKLNG